MSIIKKIATKSKHALNKTINGDKTKDKKLVEAYNNFKDFTMIPQDIYVENLRIAEALVSNIKGDIVECGVWRGGMSGGMAKILGKNRTYYLFDSFEGLPAAKEIDGTDAISWQKDTSAENYFDNCKAEIEFATKAMSKTAVDFKLVKGWFSDTLPEFKFENQIALLRLDGDWYESTMDCLKSLFPKVAENGIIIIDDYYTWEGCSKAVHDYLSLIKSKSRIWRSPGGVCYIKKTD